jgi:glycosyltransferase involved in cell wall biosynthesis
MPSSLRLSMSPQDWPAVSLCIPTFRRPGGLRRSLDHVAAQSYPGRLAVVVVDNDGTDRAGDAVVREMAPGFPFPLTGIVEPRRGRTDGCNTAFAAAARIAGTQFVAVLDDGEYPAPGRLTEMVATAIVYKADIVGGPVFPVFDEPHHWLVKTGLYAPRRYVTGPVDMIDGAASMVIRRDVLELYLDEPFSALTGGGHLDFFLRCRRDGRSFAWADEARVSETLPPSRTTVRWLLLRGFRAGTDRTRIDRSFANGAHDAMKRWVKGAGLMAWGMALLPLSLLRGRAVAVYGLIVAARGAGRLAAEFGLLYEESR